MAGALPLPTYTVDGWAGNAVHEIGWVAARELAWAAKR